MHKVFRTPELLDEVLSYLPKHTSTVAARVCRTWFAQSIPFIWGRASLNDALSVLSSFAVHSNHTDGGFQKPLSPKSWDRFFLYSKHIRYLECVDIKHTALTQATLWRPRTEFFSSKLTVLHWEGTEEHIDCLPPLLTATIEVLYISLDAITNVDTFDALLKTIGIRSPLLHGLHIGILPNKINDAARVSQSFGELVAVLPEIFAVAVPINFMTPGVFTIMSRLSKLRGLFASITSWGGMTLDMTVADVVKWKKKSTFYEELLPFHSLELLYITDALDNRTFTVAGVIGHGIPLHNLVELMGFPYCENPGEAIAIMESLPVVCPNLQSITISGEVFLFGGLPWQAVQTLLQCTRLHSLRIIHSTVNMTLEDIITVATNRPSWRNIVLHSSRPVSYQALVAFAKNSPKLAELGLSLDSRLGIPGIETLGSDVRLPSLTTLDVGHSGLTFQTHIEVGLFLSSICRNPLSILAEGRHEASWRAVEKMLDAITTARLENRMSKDEMDLLQSKKTTSRLSWR